MRSLHQIEMTSRCNLRCGYCVHPKMPRPKVDMTDEIFERCLYWVRHFVALGTQGQELNLCGIGESTMHPKFAEYVMAARDAVGRSRYLILATNGIGVTEDHARAMSHANMRVWVSLHRPEVAGRTLNMLKRYGVLAGSSTEPATASVDWAGQVEWEVTASKNIMCPWLRREQAFVMADGRVSSCCFDGSGSGVRGTVWDNLVEMPTGQYDLCAKCHHLKP